MDEAGASSEFTAAASRRGPLDGAALPCAHGLSIVVAGPAARFILRGGADAAKSAGAAFGLTLPGQLNSAVQAVTGSRFSVKLGPDEWLIGAPDQDAGEMAATLAAALSPAPHSLVDVSHRQVSLVIEGAAARRALSAGCPLDLRLMAFPVGMATRTLFLKTEIVLWRQATERFHVEVWRSFARYLIGHLTVAADVRATM